MGQELPSGDLTESPTLALCRRPNRAAPAVCAEVRWQSESAGRDPSRPGARWRHAPAGLVRAPAAAYRRKRSDQAGRRASAPSRRAQVEWAVVNPQPWPAGPR